MDGHLSWNCPHYTNGNTWKNKMPLDPIKFNFELSDMPGYENIPKNELHKTISTFFQNYFKEIGGETIVVIDGNNITVRWLPNSTTDTENAIQSAVDLLGQGAISRGEAMFEALFKKYPEHKIILYNYGMILSDKGKLDKAITMLKRLTELDPGNYQAWNALAVAHSRKGNKDKSRDALENSFKLNPEDPYTLRNLGALLSNISPQEGLPYLEKAAMLLPDDQQTQYGYGLCLLELKKYDEADSVLKKVIKLSHYTELAERAKTARSEIAKLSMRKKTGDQLRIDAVMYCLAAIKKFRELSPQKRQTITYEIAMLGRDGLDINNPDQKYTLKSMEGKFTGMQLLSYMFVGLKQIDPKLDSGIDLENEYQAALEMFNQKEN